MASYAPPVDRLLTLGEPTLSGDWEDYSRLGITSAHVSELIRLMTDLSLNLAVPASREVWGPVHAWRALAQLRATEAVGPYLDLLVALEKEDADDWVREEAPEFFTRMGPAALPALLSFLADDKHSLYPRWRVADVLVQMAEEYPETRSEAVAALTAQLEKAAGNDAELNAGLISCLVDVEAVEAAPVIERAFATRNVDESIVGDWGYVQYELGLRAEPPAPQTYVPAPGFPPGWDLPLATPSGRTPAARAKERGKAKRKATKQARKKNRKKKR